MYESELKVMIAAALKASVHIMKVYETAFEVEIKSDDSPVTEADKGADEIIRHDLHEAFPNYAMLTEESADNEERLKNDYVFIVDPVDGTKDFCARNGQFTVNIGLAYKGKPVVGVILAPVTGRLYYATDKGGSFELVDGNPVPLHVSNKTENLTMYTSNFHTTQKELDVALKHKGKITQILQRGSSLKACAIASGEGELSFRLGAGTKEWDTCASQIIVIEAGGYFMLPTNEPMTYNRADVYNRQGFVIVNRIENNFAFEDYIKHE